MSQNLFQRACYSVGVACVLLLALNLASGVLPWGGREKLAEAPIPVDGLHLLIVQESGGDYPPAQDAAIDSVVWRERIPEGQWLVLDDDQAPEGLDPKWSAAMARPRESHPWLILSNHPHGGYEGPMPGTLEELVDLIDRVEEAR